MIIVPKYLKPTKLTIAYFGSVGLSMLKAVARDNPYILPVPNVS
jgi:hypothetical protein